MPQSARIAIDLGAESCRVSLLTWENNVPNIQVIHRIPNGPIHHASSLHWPLETILAGPHTPCTTGHIIPVDGGLTEAFLR